MKNWLKNGFTISRIFSALQNLLGGGRLSQQKNRPGSSMWRTGFTLIELLIVIAIVGILTALITTNLQGARSRARDVRRKSDLRSIEQALRLYYNDAKGYPLSDSSYEIIGCDGSTCSWGDAFQSTNSVYMSSLPIDPSSSNSSVINYKYLSTDSDEYLLVATLENLSDQDIANSQNRCSAIYSGYSESDPTTDYVVCGQ
ncbi:type II secretion system protein [Candidatus Woesebacteria bacterium]|nr:type II secretion system protein [Candidatus Woesebacteria bacterium]